MVCRMSQESGQGHAQGARGVVILQGQGHVRTMQELKSSLCAECNAQMQLIESEMGRMSQQTNK